MRSPRSSPHTSRWPRRRVLARQAAPRSPDVAADLLDRAVGLMAPGDPGRDRLLAERASSLMRAGRIADAEATCRLLLGRDHDRSVEGTVRVCLGHALLARGDARDGLPELERACQSPLLTGAGGYRADWSAWAQALLLEADGERADALETLSDCWDRCARSGLAVEYPVIGPDLVRLALAADDAGRAGDVAAAVTGVASRNEVPWIVGAALRCQGLAANDAEMLQAAASAYARVASA